MTTTLYRGLGKLYGNEKYADLTVNCGSGLGAPGRVFKLHRAIVCPQSEFFDKACSGGFQVP